MERRARDRDLGSVSRESSALHQELAEQYPDLPTHLVSTALDQATRAAAALMNNLTGTDSSTTPLVAVLARDRLDAQRQRRTAAERRVGRPHHRSAVTAY